MTQTETNKEQLSKRLPRQFSLATIVIGDIIVRGHNLSTSFVIMAKFAQGTTDDVLWNSLCSCPFPLFALKKYIFSFAKLVWDKTSTACGLISKQNLHYYLTYLRLFFDFFMNFLRFFYVIILLFLSKLFSLILYTIPLILSSNHFPLLRLGFQLIAYFFWNVWISFFLFSCFFSCFFPCFFSCSISLSIISRSLFFFARQREKNTQSEKERKSTSPEAAFTILFLCSQRKTPIRNLVDLWATGLIQM